MCERAHLRPRWEDWEWSAQELMRQEAVYFLLVRGGCCRPAIFGQKRPVACPLLSRSERTGVEGDDHGKSYPSNQDRGSPLDASSRKSRLSLAVGGPPEGFEQGKLLRLLRRPFRGGRQSLAKDRAHSELSCRRDHFYGRPPGAGRLHPAARARETPNDQQRRADHDPKDCNTGRSAGLEFGHHREALRSDGGDPRTRRIGFYPASGFLTVHHRAWRCIQVF